MNQNLYMLVGWPVVLCSTYVLYKFKSGNYIFPLDYLFLCVGKHPVSFCLTFKNASLSMVFLLCCDSQGIVFSLFN